MFHNLEIFFIYSWKIFCKFPTGHRGDNAEIQFGRLAPLKKSSYFQSLLFAKEKLTQNLSEIQGISKTLQKIHMSRQIESETVILKDFVKYG